jgi:hypothetical protein
MTQRVALYARVSTARQEQEQTVASQVAALEQAARALGVSVPPERRYIDEGVSGARLDRPGLDALRDAAADGLVDLVLIHCPDRLARNYVHQHVLIEELTRRGVALHFVERPVTERAEDRLLVQMQGVIAEYERAKIIERTRRGKLHKLRTGQMLPYGAAAPYGYAILQPGAVPPSMSISCAPWWCAASAAGEWNARIKRGRHVPTSISTTPAGIITPSRRGVCCAAPRGACAAMSSMQWSGTRWLPGSRVRGCSWKRSRRGAQAEPAPHSSRATSPASRPRSARARCRSNG